jgi:hypothetical protein
VDYTVGRTNCQQIRPYLSCFVILSYIVNVFRLHTLHWHRSKLLHLHDLLIRLHFRIPVLSCSSRQAVIRTIPTLNIANIS